MYVYVVYVYVYVYVYVHVCACACAGQGRGGTCMWTRQKEEAEVPGSKGPYTQQTQQTHFQAGQGRGGAGRDGTCLRTSRDQDVDEECHHEGDSQHGRRQ